MQREQDKAVFKTYINGKNEFKNALAPIPGLSTNPAFNHTITEITNHLPNLNIIRNSPETIISWLEFEFDQEEQYPFTRNLFDDISLALGSSLIEIESIDHREYRERYTFKRSSEIAVIDFEYKSNGFWGRILPVNKESNSKPLIADIKTVLQTLKQEEYAF